MYSVRKCAIDSLDQTLFKMIDEQLKKSEEVVACYQGLLIDKEGTPHFLALVLTDQCVHDVYFGEEKSIARTIQLSDIVSVEEMLGGENYVKISEVDTDQPNNIKFEFSNSKQMNAFIKMLKEACAKKGRMI